MSDADRPYRLDDQVGFVLRQVSQRHALIFQGEAPEGLTPMQFSTLIRLHENGPSSQNELGRAAAMDVATIKGVVDRLRDKGLVAVTPYPGDRRRSRIALTPQARRMIAPLHDAGHRITEATLDPLSPAECTVLLDLLRRLT